MDSVYHETNRNIQLLQQNLGRLDQAPASQMAMVEADIAERLDGIHASCERLAVMAAKESPHRRANAKYKVDQLKYDVKHVVAAINNIKAKRFGRENEERQREALMATTFTTNDQARSHTSIELDAHLEHNQRMNDTHSQLDALLDHGSNVLSSLRDQHGTLKTARKKVLDVINTLGLTNTVMRLIERRGSQDKIIFWVGVVITCLIMYLTFWYVRS